ncbi:MAG: AAA family ATPase [Pseudomonadaceae bacterium]|nr:AAA family ATPase [Pseudomonadaceae bacterium]
MQTTDQQTLIQALQDPSLYSHETQDMALIETHISYVILCGPYVYKIKKALDLGFLDFTTLEKRAFFCQEELRLNGRLAPQLYLEVVSITGSLEHPQINGRGEALEYAVKMSRFSQEGLLSSMVQDNRLTPAHIDQIVDQVAQFHLDIPIASQESPYGTPEHVHAPVLENFTHILQQTDAAEHIRWIGEIETWANSEYQRWMPQFVARKQLGFIRECHGDMHLGNMAVIDDVPVIFDGIEFNPDLYWIDVMSEIGFLLMDLEDYGKPQYAYRFLNGYLEQTGDYAGVQVLQYYKAYRASVRAKIASIRLAQDLTDADRSEALDQFERYVKLAVSYTKPHQPQLLITHGLSGSGKSTLSAPLAEHMGAIRIRSDRERQRLFGRGSARDDSKDDGATAIDAGAYAPDASALTYAKLAELASLIINAGYPVIVDATFLEKNQRDQFHELAADLAVPVRILHFHAESEILKQRVRDRQRKGSDISEADLDVLAHQLDTYQPIVDNELSRTVIIDTQAAPSSAQIQTMIQRSLSRVPD